MQTAENVEDVSQVVQATLLKNLKAQREALCLTQAELAERAGVSRMTVQRLEAEGADTSFSSFVRLALGMGMTLRVQAPQAGANDQDQYVPRQEDIVHRGLNHRRAIKGNSEDGDFRREAALAKAWEAANKAQAVGLAPLMASLVPQHTQEQATAAATVVQWLGSEIGFDFLVKAMDAAGYDIVEKSNKRR